MEWLNIKLSTIRAPEYIGSDPTERATWLNVLAYCADQENGGRIAGAAAWKDRQWQQACGVMLREVRKASKLMWMDGEDIIVWAYPVEKEELVRSNRLAGQMGGSARSDKKAEAVRENGKLGGRPKNQSTGQLNNLSTASENNLSENQTENQSDPLVKNLSENLTERKGIGKEVVGASARAELRPEPNSPPPPQNGHQFDAEIPAESEVVSHGERSGIPPPYCREYHAKTTERNRWISGGKLIDWRRQIVRHWHEYGAEWTARQKTAGNNKNGRSYRPNPNSATHRPF